MGEPRKDTIVCGNCLEVLKEFPDNYFDACVTDPPYGLNEIKDLPGLLRAWLEGEEGWEWQTKGFMGKGWDKVPPPSIWKEVLRVLKPGAYILCFAGCRTVDLMGISLRLAGFEDNNLLAWLYGCLPEDAEILTAQGWKKGIDVQVGELVAAWNPQTEEITLQPVIQKFCAPYRGDMVVLRNADTDQLLTPNHRVYKKHYVRKMEQGVRSGWFETEWTVTEAAQINRWQQIKLPIAGWHNGPGIGGPDYAALLAWVWTEGSFDKGGHYGYGVRIYQTDRNTENVDKIDRLLRRVVPEHRRYERLRKYRGRTYKEIVWYINGDLARRIRGDLPNKKPTWSLLWRMTREEKKAFFNAAMDGDGSWRTRQFYQKDLESLEWMQALLALIGKQGRINPRKRCLSYRNSSTTNLARQRLVAHQRKFYEGLVWCVQVSTGAFVARRNGLVFITGNSGFPKGVDVGKMIDKAAGAERPRSPIQRPIDGRDGVYMGQGGNWGETLNIPQTPEAKKWDGWKYGKQALKPAMEPILLMQKPFEKGLAGYQNVLKWGTGALNIEACRIPTGDVIRGRIRTKPIHGGGLQTGVNDYHQHPNGRFPANVLLDEEAARALDELAGEQSPSRFFYVAKASTRERNAGLDERNLHPTVKPIKLLRYLVRLITPPDGIVLDPFCGTGTTCIAAMLEGFHCVGIELEPKYCEWARKRIEHWKKVEPPHLL